MVEQAKIEEIAVRICNILEVDYEEAMVSRKRVYTLTRSIIMHFAQVRLGASSNDLSKFFGIAPRTILTNKAILRSGIATGQSYYTEPFEAVFAGLDT